MRGPIRSTSTSSSDRNGTVYIGVTNNVAAWLGLHRLGQGSEFVKRSGVYRLIHVEAYARAEEAIQREKQMKKWNRAEKIRLIEQDNPEWRDLSDMLAWKSKMGPHLRGDDDRERETLSEMHMMQRPGLIITLAASLLTAITARAAEIEIPPPIKPKDLPVQANQPNCARWTDDCVTCTRGTNGAGPACSNIGFACQPKAIRCVGADSPQIEPGQK